MQSKNETNSTPSHRHPPSHKAIIRTAVKELNQLYASAQHLDPHSVYTTAIGNTQKLIEGVKFRPGSIQVGQVLLNNMALGLRLKYDRMLAGFIYLSIKFYCEAERGLAYHLGVIASMAQQKSSSSAKSAQPISFAPQTFPELTPPSNYNPQLNLAIECALKLQLQKFIPQKHLKSQEPCAKNQTVVEKSLMCLCRLVEKSVLIPSLSSLVGELYNWAFKQLKVSKRPSMYREFLVSYFQYLESWALERKKRSSMRSLPDGMLDICRLFSDCLLDAKQSRQGDSQLNSSSLSLKSSQDLSALSQPERIKKEKQNDMIGFLIRKFLYLAQQYRGVEGFYMEEHDLQETIRLSLLNAESRKTVFTIVQASYNLNVQWMVYSGKGGSQCCFSMLKQSSPEKEGEDIKFSVNLCIFATALADELRVNLKSPNTEWLAKIRSMKECLKNSAFYSFSPPDEGEKKALQFIWNHVVFQVQDYKVNILLKHLTRKKFLDLIMDPAKRKEAVRQIQTLSLAELHLDLIQMPINSGLYPQCQPSTIYLLIVSELLKDSLNIHSDPLQSFETKGSQDPRLSNLLEGLTRIGRQQRGQLKITDIRAIRASQFRAWDNLLLLALSMLSYGIESLSSMSALKILLKNGVSLLLDMLAESENTRPNGIICILQFLCSDIASNRQVLLLKIDLFVALCRHIIQPLLSVLPNGYQTVNDILAKFLFLVPHLQAYISAHQRQKLRDLRSEIIRASDMKTRSYYRAVMQKLLAGVIKNATNELEEHEQIDPASNSQAASNSHPASNSQSQLPSGELSSLSVESLQNYLNAYLQIRDPSSSYQTIACIDFLKWALHVCCMHRNTLSTAYTQIIESISQRMLNGKEVRKYIEEVAAETESVEIMLDCYNKLIYWASEGRRFGEQTKFSLEFEIEEAAIEVKHIANHLRQAHSRLNQMIPSRSLPTNSPRMAICLNNLIGIASNIGLPPVPSPHLWMCLQHEMWSPPPGGWPDAMSAFVGLRLMIAYSEGGISEYLMELSKMMFLDYVDKRSEGLMEFVKGAVVDLEEHQRQSVDLYIGESEFAQLPNPQSSSSRLLKSVYFLNKIVHMHPHKSALKAFSGHVWELNSINIARIIAYQPSLLPRTQSLLLPGELLWGQFSHRILTKTLRGLLSCNLEANQKSEFRSVLRLAVIFFTRSRHFSGIIFCLRCLLFVNFDSEPEDDNSELSQLKISNLLAITDSLEQTLACLQADSSATKAFNKFKKLFISPSTSTQRRSAASFHLRDIQICELLQTSFRPFGRLGVEMYQLYADFINYSEIYKERCPLHLLHHGYLTLKHQQEGRLGKSPTDEERLFMELFGEICEFQKQQGPRTPEEGSSEKEEADRSLRRLQYKILTQMRRVISRSYQQALVYESLMRVLQDLEEESLEERVIIEVVVLMLDHNYLYKQMVQKVPGIEVIGSSSFLDDVQAANAVYQEFEDNYIGLHFQRLDILHKIKYPCTLLYPLGAYIYNIGLRAPTTIQVLPISDKYQFEDSLRTIRVLLANNSKVLSNKEIGAQEWWKSRDRVNRAIGRIVDSTERALGVWDVCLPRIENNREDTSGEQVGIGGGSEAKKIAKMYYGASQMALQSHSSPTEGGHSVFLNKSINSCRGCRRGEELRLVDGVLGVKEHLLKSESSKSKFENENLLLLMHPRFNLFPFESMPYLSRSRAVYRIPSIAYLYEQLSIHKTNSKLIKLNHLHFLVNSNNDLPSTEESFYRIKSEYPQWKGVVGRKPHFKQLQALLSSNAFLFMGHGAGSSHLNSREFYQVRISCLMMLFGCSSAAMTQGHCEHHGIAFSHLLNGCPSLLGCLWEVTDKDTDKVTELIFKSVSHCPQNLSKIVSNAKKHCRHEFLNGGALVMFGVPTYVYIE